VSGRIAGGLRAAGLAATVVAVAVAGSLSGVAPAAAQAPASIYSPIDAYPPRVLPSGNCATAPTPGAVEFQRIVRTGAGGTWEGYINCSDSSSYHYAGRAFDWGMNAYSAYDAARVNEVLTWLLSSDDRGNPHANARRFGIGEIIWNRQIISLWDTTTSKTWRPYDCTAPGRSCHTDHVHFSFSPAGGAGTTSFYGSRNGIPKFALSDSLTSSVSTMAVFGYGFGAAEIFSGDWNEDGRDGIGIFDPTTANFYLRNSLTGGAADHQIWFGSFGDKPIAGDWDGDGQDDIGVYDPPTQRFHFFMLNGRPAPASIFYGSPGDRPLVGDWNGDGTDEVGVYNPNNSRFYQRWSASDTREFWIGDPGDIPVTGDWDGNRTTELGVYKPSNGFFHFMNGNGQERSRIHYGDPGKSPIVGDWDGRPGDTQGVVLL